MEVAMNIISVQNLSKIYNKGENEVKAVDDISFDIEKGEHIAVIGTSGSGRTTARKPNSSAPACP